MTVTNKTFSSISDFNQNLDLSHLKKETTLLQIFSGLVEKAEIQEIQSILTKKNHNINFIGTTTAGEIFQGKAIEKSITVSIISFENTTVNEGYFAGDDDFETGRKIAAELISYNTKAMILFVDGLVSNGNDIIDGIASINNRIPLAGGLAGEDGRLENTYIFDQNGIYNKGCVCIALNSDILNVYTDYQLNWQAIGKTMTVTKAEKNRLYEIDCIPIDKMYTKYLGEEVGQNLPFSAVEFPLLKIEDDGLEVCRTFTHQFDDGSLLTIGNLEVGDKVRFSFGNIDLILKNATSHITQYATLHPEVLFVYSCAARKSLMQSKINHELLPLNKIAPNVGFFTYGEIYHKNNKVSLLNESFTLLALCEQEHQESTQIIKNENVKLPKKKINNFLQDKHFLILNALTNLSNRVIMELEEAQQQLREQSNRDFLTNLYNRRYFSEVSKNIVDVSRRENKSSSIISIDIDYFKKINDTYGHHVGDEVLKKLAEILQSNTRKSDIVARFGGEEFIILLPFTNIQGAQKIAKKLKETVEKTPVEIDNIITVPFTISIGIATIEEYDLIIDEVLNRADKALYQAKENGRNQIVIGS
jgi:diguanylate cyclase (GGDEF)-like protein